MSRDVKAGMLIGLVVVTVAVIVTSMWPGTTVEDRLRKNPIAIPPQDPAPATHQPDAVVDDPPVETPVEPAREVNDAARQAVHDAAPPAGPPAPLVHIVAENENLSTIAQTHYGDAAKWPLIAEANKKILPDANRVRPGMRLVIPLPTGH